MPVEDVVAQNQRARLPPYKALSNNECLRQPVRTWLLLVVEVDTPLRAISQQRAECREVAWCRDYQDIAYAAEHEDGQGIVDERFVVDRQDLLGNHMRHRVQPSAAAAGKDDAFHDDFASRDVRIRRALSVGISKSLLHSAKLQRMQRTQACGAGMRRHARQYGSLKQQIGLATSV